MFLQDVCAFPVPSTTMGIWIMILRYYVPWETPEEELILYSIPPFHHW